MQIKNIAVVRLSGMTGESLEGIGSRLIFTRVLIFMTRNLFSRTRLIIDVSSVVRENYGRINFRRSLSVAWGSSSER